MVKSYGAYTTKDSCKTLGPRAIIKNQQKIIDKKVEIEKELLLEIKDLKKQLLLEIEDLKKRLKVEQDKTAILTTALIALQNSNN